MKKIYFTPGPSQLYPTVKKHILKALEEDIPSISHRSKMFHEMVGDLYKNLRLLFNIPENYSIFFTASATEAMERIIENCVGESSFHFVNGTFAKRFYQIAKELKKDAAAENAELGEPFDFENIKIPEKSELICITQNETSSGISIPIDEIYKIADKYPEKLVAVDIVSSVPYVNLDLNKVDCAFFSIQKGFGLPAGLGILIVSPRALAKAEELDNKNYNIGSYHKFPTMSKEAVKNQTIETPNVLAIYLLNAVLQNMLHYGIEKIRNETKDKAKLIYDFFTKNQSFGQPFVKDHLWRSNTVIVIKTPKGSKTILAKLAEHGFIVGAGYGEMKEKQIRIANFPSHSQKDITNLLNFFEKLN